MNESHPGVTCREQINQFLGEYLADELTTPQRTVFERHMDDCPPCRDYLDSYRKTIDCMKAACCHLKNPELALIPNDLIKAILAARSAESRS